MTTPVCTSHPRRPGECGRRYSNDQHAQAALSGSSHVAASHALLLSGHEKDPRRAGRVSWPWATATVPGSPMLSLPGTTSPGTTSPGPPAQDPTTLCGCVRVGLSFQTLDVFRCGHAGFPATHAGGGLAAHPPPHPRGTGHWPPGPRALASTTSCWHLPCLRPGDFQGGRFERNLRSRRQRRSMCPKGGDLCPRWPPGLLLPLQLSKARKRDPRVVQIGSAIQDIWPTPPRKRQSHKS